MKSIFSWFISHQNSILYVVEWVLLIVFIGLCILLALLVLLQRGEEGAFSKNRGDKTTSDNKTLLRATIICSSFLFGVALLLNGVIHITKHTEKQTISHIVSSDLKDKSISKKP